MRDILKPLILALCLALAACGGGEAEPDVPLPRTDCAETPRPIGCT